MNLSKSLLPALACLMMLLIASAAAAPVMSLSSFANYHLSASTSSIQDCNSGNVTIAAFVCPNNQSSVQVNVNGDGSCVLNDASCFFNPASVTISGGMTVTWHDLDINSHNISSNSTLNGSLPSFNTYVYPGSFTSQQFVIPGTYHYSDPAHAWMKGIVVVTPAVKPPSIITSFGADGSMGWNVAGLSQTDALLGVNHRISVYDQTTTPQTLVYNDSGTLEQYVDLSTREESPTTLVLFQSLPFGLGFPGFYGGFGPGFGGYGYPPPFIYPGSFYNFQPVRTLWWVNGPLDNGSIVELLTGHASVTGSKSIQLQSPLVHQDAWSVAMVNLESTNQSEPAPSNGYNFYCPGIFFFGGPQPQPQCFISRSILSVSLTADYSQHSDLLVDISATVSSLTETTANYPAGSTIYNNLNGYYGNGITVTSPVSIVRTTTSKITLTLGLSNTNLDMSKRMALQASQTGGTTANTPSPTANQPIPLTIEYLLAGIGIMALASSVIWAVSRGRRKPTVTGIPTSTIPTP